MEDQATNQDAGSGDESFVPAAGIAIQPDPPDPPSKDIDAPDSDYAGAVWRLSPYQNARNTQIDMVVIHDTEGGFGPSLDWLCSERPPNQQSSAHYMFRSSDGFLAQMVRENKIAWHAGEWGYNQRSIGIEHEGFFAQPELWYTDTMLQASAKLTADICRRYSIPIDRDHIIGHMEVVADGKLGGSNAHRDPGSGWPWDKYLGLVRTAAGLDKVIAPDPDYAVYGPATISLEQFIQTLQQANSPALEEASDCYQVCLDNGVNPAVALAFFALESNYGNALNAADRKNWGNLSDHTSGQLRIYDAWALGLRDWATHFQQGAYADKGLKTISQIVPAYQPASTGSTTTGYNQYISKLHDLIQGWKS